jgi:hypothetical protein
MTSKKLGSLLSNATTATPVSQPTMATPPPHTPQRKKHVPQDDVPLQVLIPRDIRKQVDLLAVEENVSLRTIVLRGLKKLGLDVPDAVLQGKYSRKM